jgi:glycerophosphoryl diester phosphodiesterase
MRSELQTDFFTAPHPRVIAHRGASGDYPENTMPAFHAAALSGAAYIELDVHRTRDGEVVVAHDDDLMRIASHEGLIAQMTFAELSEIDAGFNFSRSPEAGFPYRGQGISVPRLADVLSSCARQRFVVEFKAAESAIADAALEVVQATGMERMVLFASEHPAAIARIRLLAPQIPTNLPPPEIGAFIQSLAPGAAPYTPAGDALQVPPEYLGWRLVTAESVAAAHRSGLEVHVWTVNDEAEISQLLALGVDGIITDFPLRLLRLLQRR